MGEMKRYYSFFTSHPGDWRPCSKEHHDMVRANPQDWPGYEVRELAVIPAGHVVVPRELLERIRSQLDLRAEFDQTYPPETQPVNDDARLFLELRALLSEQDKRNRQGTLDSCYSGGSNETETIA
ncbi:TPA: hypothetical protein VDW15_004474 [Pseudomonas aeruginosa]|nr:hypothetical protein [Pseudomonas aeruginosa]